MGPAKTLGTEYSVLTRLCSLSLRICAKIQQHEESIVIDKNKSAEQYWRANLRLIFGCLVVWALVSYGFAILLRPMLASISVGGTDLGFWFAQQGSMITFIVLIFFYSWRMNTLDKQFNVHED
jgi:putative solute:sodium symporter small subunit